MVVDDVAVGALALLLDDEPIDVVVVVVVVVVVDDITVLIRMLFSNI